MKKITVLLLSVVLLATACKENKETKDAPSFEENLTAHYMDVYEKSMKLNDFVTASSALSSYFMLVGDSARNASPYLDTLVILYQEIRQFAPVFVLSDEYLKTSNPNDTDMLLLNTSVAQLLGGLGKVSERCYQLAQMFPKDRTHMFNYAESLFENGKVAEGEQIYKDLLNDPATKNESITFNSYDQNGQPRQNYIKTRVAAYMKLGQLYEALKDKDKAISYYRKATKEDSEFRPAYQAIQELRNR